MSLKTNLHALIKNRYPSYVTLKEIYQYCDKAHYAYSNAQRRLRGSESPNIIPVMNDKRTAIIGYKWKSERDIVAYLNQGIEKKPVEQGLL